MNNYAADRNETIKTSADRLKEIAKNVRIKIIDMIYKAQSGHPGGSLSAADIVTALYFDIMRIDPKNPDWPDRDRFVLSKGHACPVWYVVLSMVGYFDESHLETFRKFESILQGHPDMKKTPGVDITTGSLGHGLGLGLGMGLEAKYSGKDFHVYVMLGDGELNEGQIWEAAMAVPKFGCSNVTAIIDRNRLQLDGNTETIMPMEPIDEKFSSFGWEVVEIDGHDFTGILTVLDRSKMIKMGKKPLCIIANTIKGKGVSFMENQLLWHGKPPNDEQYKTAMKELQGEFNRAIDNGVER